MRCRNEEEKKKNNKKNNKKKWEKKNLAFVFSNRVRKFQPSREKLSWWDGKIRSDDLLQIKILFFFSLKKTGKITTELAKEVQHSLH